MKDILRSEITVAQTRSYVTKQKGKTEVDPLWNMPFTNPVNGTRMRILTRCLWSVILISRQDAALIRII